MYIVTLIVTLLLGLIIALFATQNTGPISLHFLPKVTSYMVVVGPLLVGLFLSWIISLVNDIATDFTIRGKEVLDELFDPNFYLRKIDTEHIVV